MKFIFCVIIGTLFAVRTIRTLKSLGYIASSSRVFDLIVLLIPILMSLWIAQAPDFTLWFLALILHLSPGLCLWIIESRRRKQFHKETARFFDRLLLGVRSGVSVREVLRQIAKDPEFGFHTRDFADASLRQDSSLFETQELEFRKRAADLRRILTSGHRVSDRIQSLRRKYQMRDRFQRKSRLAVQPVRAQILVIFVLYIGLLVIQTMNDPKILLSVWFFVSFACVGTGVGVIHYLQRSFKWKI